MKGSLHQNAIKNEINDQSEIKISIVNLNDY